MYIQFFISIIIILLLCKLYNNNTVYETFNYSNYKLNPLNIFFDKVYVIALPKRKDYMINLMKKHNINVEIFDALTPDNLDKDYLYKNNLISKDCNLNNGRIYCHMSHIYVLKDMIKNNYKNCFIFEDDIKDDINKKTINLLRKSLELLPKDYDLYYASKCYDDKNKMKKINDIIYEPYSPKSRHAYGVSFNGAKKIIKYTLPMGNLCGDEMYVKNIIKNKLKAYSLYEQLFHQDRKRFGTNLGNYTLKTPTYK